MRELDVAHVSTWLNCLTTSTDLEHAIIPDSFDLLSGLMDLPPSYAGICLQSLERSADEELLGLFIGIADSMIAACRKTEAPV